MGGRDFRTPGSWLSAWILPPAAVASGPTGDCSSRDGKDGGKKGGGRHFPNPGYIDSLFSASGNQMNFRSGGLIPSQWNPHQNPRLLEFTRAGQQKASVEGIPCINIITLRWASLVTHLLKKSSCNAGDPSLISGLGRSVRRRVRLPTPMFLGFPSGSVGKEYACHAGDLGSIPELGRSLGGGLGNPLQYSCLENRHGQRSLAAAVHGVAKNRT